MVLRIGFLRKTLVTLVCENKVIKSGIQCKNNRCESGTILRLQKNLTR
jgi:hypothetical protein